MAVVRTIPILILLKISSPVGDMSPMLRAERDIDYQVIDSESPPYFVNTSRSLVYTTVGATLTLVCRVRNLGDRSVSWIRKSDLHILTVGLTSYTNDQKFFPTHPPGSDEWNLRISNPGLKDSGTYECQINTEPKRGRAFHLDVVISQATIQGDRELFVQSGSDLNLTCTCLTTPEPPVAVLWLHNGRRLHLSSRGGIAIITEKRRRTSHLLISRLGEGDSGNYSCLPSNAENDTVIVHVLEGLGGQPRANMMSESGTSLLPSGLLLVLILLLLAVLGELQDPSSLQPLFIIMAPAGGSQSAAFLVTAVANKLMLERQQRRAAPCLTPAALVGISADRGGQK